MLVHVGAIGFYWFRKGQNLVRPMWVGDKLLPADVPASADGARARGLALVLVALCAVLVGWLVSLGD